MIYVNKNVYKIINDIYKTALINAEHDTFVAGKTFVKIH